MDTRSIVARVCANLATKRAVEAMARAKRVHAQVRTAEHRSGHVLTASAECLQRSHRALARAR